MAIATGCGELTTLTRQPPDSTGITLPRNHGKYVFRPLIIRYTRNPPSATVPWNSSRPFPDRTPRSTRGTNRASTPLEERALRKTYFRYGTKIMAEDVTRRSANKWYPDRNIRFLRMDGHEGR